jgi:hypothetical protein
LEVYAISVLCDCAAAGPATPVTATVAADVISKFRREISRLIGLFISGSTSIGWRVVETDRLHLPIKLAHAKALISGPPPHGVMGSSHKWTRVLGPNFPAK